MNKDFENWNNEKQKLEKLDYDNFYVNKRDIYYTKMWVNIGFEENWKEEFLRPVLVLKKVGKLFFTVALTSKWKDNHDFYHKFETAKFDDNNKKYENNSYCILSQVRVMDKKRFTEKIWFIEEDEFIKVKEKLKKFLF